VLKIKSLMAVGILALSLLPMAAQATTIAFSTARVDSPVNYQAGIPVNLGMVFSISSTINVNALGVYYMPELTGSEQVGLYDSVGNLLTSTTVNLSDPISSGYLFHSIAPVTLAPGIYTVDAQVNNNPWGYGLPGTAPGINFLYNDYLYSSSLQYPPTPNGSGPAYFGPNFKFDATSVPEPLTLSLFGAGLAGAAAMRRRKKKIA
jgi:hypothetical protein